MQVDSASEQIHPQQIYVSSGKQNAAAYPTAGLSIVTKLIELFWKRNRRFPPFRF